MAEDYKNDHQDVDGTQSTNNDSDVGTSPSASGADLPSGQSSHSVTSQSGDSVIVTKYNDNNQITEVETTHKDADGNVTELSIVKYGEHGSITSESITSYSQSGDATTLVNKVYQEDGSSLEDLVVSYGAGGQVSSEKFSIYSKDGNIMSVETKIYDEDGNVVELTITQYGDNGEVASITVTSYGANGVVSSVKVSTFDSDGTYKEVKVTQYDENGNIREVSTTLFGDNGEVTSTHLVIYGVNGLVNSELEKIFDLDGNIYSTTEKQYNLEGDETKLIVTFFGADGEVASVTTTTYGHDGQVLSTTQEEFPGFSDASWEKLHDIAVLSEGTSFEDPEKFADASWEQVNAIPIISETSADLQPVEFSTTASGEPQPANILSEGGGLLLSDSLDFSDVFGPTSVPQDFSSTAGLVSGPTGGDLPVEPNYAPFFVSLPHSNVDENTTFVRGVKADDPNTYHFQGNGLLFSIVEPQFSMNGVDGNLFAIDPITGEFNFIIPPDYELPIDYDGDNLYHIELRVTDSYGLFATQDYIVTVNDVNEAPVISLETGDSDAEGVGEGVTNVTLNITGTMTVFDQDNPNAPVNERVMPNVLSVAASDTILGLDSDNSALLAMLMLSPNQIIATNYPNFPRLIENNIMWEFDSGNEYFDYLAVGEHLTLTYQIQGEDLGGLQSNIWPIMITIDGSNDAPDITVQPGDTDTTNLVETNLALVAFGTLTVQDLDLSDSVTPSVLSVTTSGANAGISSTNAELLAMMMVSPANIPADVDYPGGPGDTNNLNWSFLSNNDTFDFLNDGEIVTISYTIRTTDTQGGTDDQIVNIVVTGTNDDPVISIETGDSIADTIDEDIVLAATGTITVRDVDFTETLTATVESVVTGGDDANITADNSELLALLTVLGDGNAAGGPIDAYFGDVGGPGIVTPDSNNIQWNFSHPPRFFDFINNGETLTLTYTIRATEDLAPNVFKEQQITITINGTNDDPVITVQAGDSDAESLTETNAPLAVNGTLTVRDPDHTDTVTATVESVTASHTVVDGITSTNAELLAMLSLGANPLDAYFGDVIGATTIPGDINNLEWFFNSTPEAFDYLNNGETLTLTYRIRTTEDSAPNAFDEHDVVITIIGTNDAPVISLQAGDSAADTLTETDVPISTTGTLTVRDLDFDDTVTATVESVTTAGDDACLTSTNAELLAMMALTGGPIDAYAGDPGGPGVIAPDSNNLTWTFTSTLGSFDFLDNGEVITLTYRIRTTENQSPNAFDERDVVITIVGTNDEPVITVEAGDSDNETLTETNAPLAVNDTLTVRDPDCSDTVVASVQGVVASGDTLGITSTSAELLAMMTVTPGSLNAYFGDPGGPGVIAGDINNLEWFFASAPEAFNYLNNGEILTLTYTIRATEETNPFAFDEHQVTINIVGTNDAPVISLQAGDDDSKTLTESNVPLMVTDTLTVRDLDFTETLTPTVQQVTATGNTTGITATNAELLAMLTVGPGTIDAYAGDPGGPTIPVAADINNLTWTFNSAPEAFNYLNNGETLVLTYRVRAAEDQFPNVFDEHDITITIVGTNDAPEFFIVAGDSAAETITETDAPITTTGTVTVRDKDFNDTVSITVDRVVTSGDDANITSDNNELLAMMSVIEEGGLDAIGIDAYYGDPGGPTVPQAADSNNVRWTFLSTPGSFDFINNGETLVLTYTLRATEDSNPFAFVERNVVITIIGTNDEPVITIEAGDDDTKTLTETNAPLAVNDTLTVRDPDHTETITATVETVMATGNTTGLTSSNAELLAMMSLGANPLDAYFGDVIGATTIPADVNNLEWFFNSASNLEAFNYLNNGETLVLTYKIRTTEDQSPNVIDEHDVVITINGTNDAPVISVQAGDSDAATLIETDLPISTNGTLTVRDPDHTDEVTVSVQTVVASGDTLGITSTNAELLAMLTVNPGPLDAYNGDTIGSGTATGDLNNINWNFLSTLGSFDYLNNGETLVLTYKIRTTETTAPNVFDEHNVVITITGTNDEPLLSIQPGDADTKTLTETNAPLMVSDTFTIRDPDFTETLTASVQSVAKSGDVGGITVTDAQLFSMFSVTMGPIDAYFGDPGGPTVPTAADSNNLTWNFDSSVIPTAFDYLNNGETLTLTYRVRATEDQSPNLFVERNVVINITGTNDAPVISVQPGDDDTKTLTETDSPLIVSDQLTVRDADHDDAVVLSVEQVTASGNTAGITSTNAELLNMMNLAPGGILDAYNGGGVNEVTLTPDFNNITWTFNSNSEAFDFLNNGETLVLTYRIRATEIDAPNAFDDHNIVITIIGTNDDPIVSILPSDTITDTILESDVPLTDTGTITVRDKDFTETITATIVLLEKTGNEDNIDVTDAQILSMLTLKGDGNPGGGPMDAYFGDPGGPGIITPDSNNLQWIFQSTAGSFNYLDDGESIDLIYTIRFTEDQVPNQFVDQKLTITILGTNDEPVISLVTTDSAAATRAETDTTITANGTLTVNDLDYSDQVVLSVNSVVASGTVTGLQSNNAALLAMMVASPLTAIDANPGDVHNITWNFNSGTEAFNYLEPGQSLVLTYTILATDDSGISDDQTVTITINGTNDAPDITVQSTGSPDSSSKTIQEMDIPLTVNGTLTVRDPDLTDDVTLMVQSVATGGTTAGLSSTNAQLLSMLSIPTNVAADPSDIHNIPWVFDSSSNGERFDYLAQGQMLTLTYTIRGTDNHGAFDQQTITINITGTNDTPVITVNTTGTPDSDSAALIESNNTDTTGITLSTNGTLTINDADQSDTVSMTLQSVTASGTTTGLGSNNAALLSMLSITPLSPTTLPANPGQTHNVAWAFNSGAEGFDYLDDGEQLVLSYVVRGTDNLGNYDEHTITLTITGTNDSPDITPNGTLVRNHTETDAPDLPISDSGTLTVTDVDLSDAVTLTQLNVVASGPTGGLTTPQLNAMMSFSPLAPTLISANPGASNNISWNFDSGAETFNFLANGEVLTLDYTVRATDDSGATDDKLVRIRITGTNDTPVVTIGAGDSASADINETNTTLTATDTLTIQDQDLSDTVMVTINSVAATGTTTGLGSSNAALLSMLSLNPIAGSSVNADPGDTSNQTWIFNSGVEAFNYLNVGETLTLTYALTVTDGISSVPQTITIRILGTNDAPVISDITTDSSAAMFTESNSTLSSNGTLTVNDLDLSDTVDLSVLSVSATGDTSGLGSNNATLLAMMMTSPSNVAANPGQQHNFNWDFNSGKEGFAYLGVGDQLKLDYTILATDQNGGTGTHHVIITIDGANSVPTIGGDSNGDVTEDLNLQDTGLLTITDPDPGESQFKAQTNVNSTNGYGTYSITSGGTWTYNLKNTLTAVQQLAQGAILTDKFTVTSFDGTATQQVDITINGNNDAPVANPDTANATENGSNVNIAVLANDTDIDTDDSSATLKVIAATATSGATVTFSGAAGAGITYVPGSQFDSLAAGQKGTDTINYTIVDSHGATSSSTVTVTVTGVNDVPTLGGDSSGVVQEDVILTDTGLLTISDPDTGESKFMAVTSGSATYGSYSITDTGNWTYNLNNALAKVQQLPVGGSLADSFVATSQDGTANITVNITINGTNDIPTTSNVTLTGVTEDGPAINGTFIGADVDTDDTNLTLVYNNTTNPSEGSVNILTQNKFSFAPGLDFQDLPAPGTLGGAATTRNVTFNYQATDSHGAMSNVSTVTVTVTGVNDTPTIGGVTSGTVQEDNTLQASASLTISDPDNGESFFTEVKTAKVSDNKYGTYTLSKSGFWVYDLDNNNAAVQALNTGDTLIDKFTAVSLDGTGNKVVTITIQGEDEVPAPDVGITAINAVQDEDSGTPHHFRVTRTGDLSSSSTVTWQIVEPDGDPLGTDTVPPIKVADASDFSIGTNVSNADYTINFINAVSGTITFNAGKSAPADLFIVSTADTSFEENENFSVKLTGGTNVGNKSPDTALGTITNDDAAPSISISAVTDTLLEGSGGSYKYTVTRTGDPNAVITFDWDVQGTGANPTLGGDFSGKVFPSENAVVMGKGVSTYDIIFQPFADDTPELNETFDVVLSNVIGAGTGTTSAGGTINDDDAFIRFKSATLSQAEGTDVTPGATTSFDYTVERFGGSGYNNSQIQVEITFTNINAEAIDFDGAAFPPSKFTIDILPGMNEATGSILINPDILDESADPDSYKLEITGISNVGGGPGLGLIGGMNTLTTTIENDDFPVPALQIQAFNANQREDSGTDHTFKVIRSGTNQVFNTTVEFEIVKTDGSPLDATSAGVSINNAAIDDFDNTTDVSNSVYKIDFKNNVGGTIDNTRGTITFFSTVGTTNQEAILILPSLADFNLESDENFQVRLFNATDGNITSGLDAANGTIRDDEAYIKVEAIDDPGTGNVIASSDLEEGNTHYFRFTRLGWGSDYDIKTDVANYELTSTVGTVDASDFSKIETVETAAAQGITGKLTFGSGAANDVRTVAFTTNNDTEVETATGDEKFNIAFTTFDTPSTSPDPVLNSADGTIINNDTKFTIVALTPTSQDEGFTSNFLIDHDNDPGTPDQTSPYGPFTYAYQIQRSGAEVQSGHGMTVKFTISGTNITDSDFSAIVLNENGFTKGLPIGTPSEIIFQGGEDYKTLIITTDGADDSVPEIDEIFTIALDSTVTIANPGTGPLPGQSASASGSVMGTIKNNDPLPLVIPVVSIADSTAVLEGGNHTFNITINRGAGVTKNNGAVIVDFNITGGPADANDFDLASVSDGNSSASVVFTSKTSGTISFGMGVETPQSLVFTSLDDAINESDEGFTVTLTPNGGSPTTVQIGGSGTATGEVIDAPFVTVQAVTSPTPTEGGVNAQLFKLTRTGTDLSQDTTVNYTFGAGLSGDPAESGDISGGFGSGSITFTGGASEVFFTRSLLEDADFVDETVRLIIDSNGGSASNSSVGTSKTSTAFAENTIVDNDTLTLSTISVTNANEETGTKGTFKLGLSQVNTTGSAITVNYSISGSATAGVDYQTLSGTATIANGSQFSAPIDVNLLTDTGSTSPNEGSNIDDKKLEGTENVIMTVTGVSGGIANNTSATSLDISDSKLYIGFGHGTTAAAESGYTGDLGNPGPFTTSPQLGIVLRSQAVNSPSTLVTNELGVTVSAELNNITSSGPILTDPSLGGGEKAAQSTDIQNIDGTILSIANGGSSAFATISIFSDDDSNPSLNSPQNTAEYVSYEVINLNGVPLDVATQFYTDHTFSESNQDNLLYFNVVESNITVAALGDADEQAAFGFADGSFRLTNNSGTAATVTFTLGGSATYFTDYTVAGATESGGTFTASVGASSFTDITITPTAFLFDGDPDVYDDTILEGDETVSLDIQTVNGNMATGSDTLNIKDANFWTYQAFGRSDQNIGNLDEAFPTLTEHVSVTLWSGSTDSTGVAVTNGTIFPFTATWAEAFGSFGAFYGTFTDLDDVYYYDGIAAPVFPYDGLSRSASNHSFTIPAFAGNGKSNVVTIALRVNNDGIFVPTTEYIDYQFTAGAALTAFSNYQGFVPSYASGSGLIGQQRLSYGNQAPPVVLDLDDDGVELVAVADSNVYHDVDNDGVLEHIAWVGKDDALLVYDKNGNHHVDSPDEWILTRHAPQEAIDAIHNVWLSALAASGGIDTLSNSSDDVPYYAQDGILTDLEALQLAFDSNGDFVFDANDEAWGSFGIWQDINQDGIQDEGEYKTLDEAGITSIDLNSNNEAYESYGSIIYGESHYTLADGSIHIAGDVGLAYTEVVEGEDSIQNTSASDAVNVTEDAGAYSEAEQAFEAEEQALQIDANETATAEVAATVEGDCQTYDCTDLDSFDSTAVTSTEDPLAPATVATNNSDM